jgi:FKBP-type peptidyl-prolyl cis-trans isomerase
MKKIIILIAALFTLQMANAGGKKLKTSQDSISYAVGYIVGGQQLSSFIISKYGCNKEVFLKAVTDAINGDSTTMNQNKATKIMQKADDKISEKEEDKKENAYKTAKAVNDRYLDDNLKRSGYKEIPNSWDSTARGVQYRVIKAGDGETPTASSAVKFNYSYRLTDGTLISKSSDGEPTEGQISNLLPGLQDALTSMPVGSKWEIVIPSELGFDKEEQYYDDGRVMIPANSILIFELELLNTGTPEDIDDEK